MQNCCLNQNEIIKKKKKKKKASKDLFSLFTKKRLKIDGSSTFIVTVTKDCFFEDMQIEFTLDNEGPATIFLEGIL